MAPDEPCDEILVPPRVSVMILELIEAEIERLCALLPRLALPVLLVSNEVGFGIVPESQVAYQLFSFQGLFARFEIDVQMSGAVVVVHFFFNHNLETVPRLYKRVRPGADYQHSLNLLRAFGDRFSKVPTKSGLMLGLGEDIEEVVSVMHALRRHGVSLLTLGQYLQPTRHHLPVERYVPPAEFSSN